MTQQPALNRFNLSPGFLQDLKCDRLLPVLNRVHLDRTLNLEVRDSNKVQIYYRGGALCDITAVGNAYEFVIGDDYTKHVPTTEKAHFENYVWPSKTVLTQGEAQQWVNTFQDLKLLMHGFIDRVNLNKKKGREREFAQLLVRENNSDLLASDYFICDTEVAVGDAQFDAVGVHWPSSIGGHSRKKTTDRRLAIIEAKYGDGALKGKAGILDHVEKTERLCAEPKILADLKLRAQTRFNEKLTLCLIRNENALTSFSTDKPLLIFVLAAHDPDGRQLSEELEKLHKLEQLTPFESIDIRFAVATFFGYALFDGGILTLGEFRYKFGSQIRTPSR